MTDYEEHMDRRTLRAVLGLSNARRLDDVRRWMDVRPDFRHAVGRVVGAPILASLPRDDFQPVRDWFGITCAAHPFNYEEQRWLKLTETQVMAGFCSFLTEGPSARVTTFLHATAPWIEWSDTIAEWEVEVEVPAADRKRMDLVIRPKADGEAGGLVIEAKLWSNLKGNPLELYRRRAGSGNYNISTRPDASGIHRGALVVVAPRLTAGIAGRLQKHAAWKFMSWAMLLSRFERLLDPAIDSGEFAKFRKKVWECL